MGSHSVTWCRWHSRLYPSRSWYSIYYGFSDPEGMQGWVDVSIKLYSRGAQPVPKAVYRSGCHDKHNQSTIRGEILTWILSHSDALTNVSLRPVFQYLRYSISACVELWQNAMLAGRSRGWPMGHLSVAESKVSNISLRHTHTDPFNGPLSATTRVSRYQKGKTSLDFTEARQF